MRVFVTGATGFVGFSVTEELIRAGHQVIGLARTESAASALTAAGAQAHPGDLEDLESLRTGASMADGAIHCGFNHDFSKFAASCDMDRQAIETLGSVFSGSDRPLIVTAGIGRLAQGRASTEEDRPMSNPAFPRVSEQTAISWAERGVNAAVVRLPQVHDHAKQGFVSYLVEIARKAGVSAYVGDGSNRWAAGHRTDVARLYRLALERTGRNTRGAKYHAVGEEGVPLKDIAEAIGRGLKVPVVAKSVDEAAGHWGPFLGSFAGFDMPASSALTQQRLDWQPTGPQLLADLAAMAY
jgi:nucleoside-diphosphate-sugar epimerase